MSNKDQLSRGARGIVARLQNMRSKNAPDAPALGLRDPWPGDPSRGVRLVKGELEFAGAVLALTPGVFTTAKASTVMRAQVHGFTWLRDLRALGTDAARARARFLVSEFMDTEVLDYAGTTPDVTGARLAAWLGHYDFFAASADDDFRQRLMRRLVMDARMLSAALPSELLDGRALTALKGLAAASVAMPEHVPALPRVIKFLTPEIARQFHTDGCHIERSPAAHLAALQDLTEIRALLQAAGSEPPPELLAAAIDKAAGALRAMRHGDGGLALFDGTKEELGSLIDLVLAQAGRTRGAPGVLNVCGLHRLSAGRAVLFLDGGLPAAPRLDRNAHAGTLSFEFSYGKERIITNCGAAPAVAGAWSQALRSTAAHSTLTVADVSSSELRETGLGRKPILVWAERQTLGATHWIEANHDGWASLFGAMHHRRLGLSENGEMLLGEDLIEAGQPQPFTVRFHLHPNVTASLQQNDGAVLLRLGSGQGWRLKAEGAPIRVEESVYFGQAEPRRAEQVVLAGHQDGKQHVKWSITKI
jgi:uncharacterized heparinase superfamily protein